MIIAVADGQAALPFIVLRVQFAVFITTVGMLRTTHHVMARLKLATYTWTELESFRLIRQSGILATRF